MVLALSQEWKQTLLKRREDRNFQRKDQLIKLEEPKLAEFLSNLSTSIMGKHRKCTQNVNYSTALQWNTITKREIIALTTWPATKCLELSKSVQGQQIQCTERGTPRVNNLPGKLINVLFDYILRSYFYWQHPSISPPLLVCAVFTIQKTHIFYCFAKC
jgi:hypothetical protein